MLQLMVPLQADSLTQIVEEIIPTSNAFTFSDVFNGDLIYTGIRIVIILLLTFGVVRLYKKIAKRIPGNNKIHNRFINNTVTVAIYLLGILTALGQVNGLSSLFAAVMTTSGIAALAISLAAQESLGNAINGVFMSISKPFEVGDRVRLIGGNITGYVEDITLRHTIIRTFVNSRIIIPNSVISKDMIENSNFQEVKASSFIDVVITYDSDMELAQEIMRRAVEEHPDFVDSREPDQRDQPKSRVYVRNLGLYGVELRISMWTQSIGNNFDACSDVRHRIKKDFDEAGITFARPPVAGPSPQ